MATQTTTTYKKRLRCHSGLSPMARLVAATIADLRYEDQLQSHEPLQLSMPELAEACGMKSKNTARRWLEEAIAAGWIIAAAVYRDHRQQPNEYYIADPTNPAEVKRLTSAIEASGSRLLRSSVRPVSVKRLDTVVRSNNKFGDDGAAPRGGGGDEQGQIQTVASSPAQPQAARPDATEADLLASAQSPRQSRLWPNGISDEEAITGPAVSDLLDQLGIKRSKAARDLDQLRYRRQVAEANRLLTEGEPA